MVRRIDLTIFNRDFESKRHLFKDLKPDSFYHVCPAAENAKVESEEAMKTLVENQKSCAENLSNSLQGDIIYWATVLRSIAPTCL